MQFIGFWDSLTMGRLNSKKEGKIMGELG